MKWYVLFICLAASGVVAQDRVELVQRVERWSTQAQNASAGANDRLEAIERAMQGREALMAALPDDAHRPIWLLDQSSDTLLALTLRMHDARLVVGLLDERERREALDAAEAAYALADTAGVLISARFEAQQRIIDSGGQLAQGDRALNVRLAETELALRRPLLMGRAMALQVAGGGEVADPNQVFALLEGVRLSPGGPSALRDASLAIVLSASQSDSARARASELLASVVDLPDAGATLRAEASLLRATLGQTLSEREAAIDEAAQRPPFVDDQGLVYAALAVLAVEARARILAQADRFEDAARVLMALPERRDLGGTAEQLEAIVNDRLATLARRAPRWDDTARDVALRTAEALVAQDRIEDDDRAIRVLEGLVARIEADRDEVQRQGAEAPSPQELAPAMVLLARLHMVRAQRVEPASQDEASKVRAVELVLALLDMPAAELGGLLGPAASLALGPVGAGLDAAEKRTLLEAAIDREDAHPQADRWRLGLATVLIEANTDWSGGLRLVERAMRSEDADVRTDAIALAGAIHGVLAASESATIETLQAAMAFARQNPSASTLDARTLGLHVAEVLVERRRPEDARQALDALAADQSKPAIILRGRALAQLGRNAEAVAELRRATELVSAENDGSNYWLVWTLLLELVDRERGDRLKQGNAEAARTLEQSIRGHLIRLRGVDAGLGGAPYAGRLAAIEARLGG